MNGSTSRQVQVWNSPHLGLQQQLSTKALALLLQCSPMHGPVPIESMSSAFAGGTPCVNRKPAPTTSMTAATSLGTHILGPTEVALRAAEVDIRPAIGARCTTKPYAHWAAARAARRSEIRRMAMQDDRKVDCSARQKSCKRVRDRQRATSRGDEEIFGESRGAVVLNTKMKDWGRGPLCAGFLQRMSVAVASISETQTHTTPFSCYHVHVDLLGFHSLRSPASRRAKAKFSPHELRSICFPDALLPRRPRLYVSQDQR